jgi:hypothetical protein
MKVDKEKQVKQMLQEAKIFVSLFDEFVSNLNIQEIEDYRNELKKP